MGKIALAIFSLILLGAPAAFASTANIDNNISAKSSGGNSSVNVNVNNEVNTGSQNTTSSQTNTKVDIEQSGEGHSSVKINGKEYKVDGTGSLHINEPGSSSNPSPTPTINPSPSSSSSSNSESSISGNITKQLEEVKSLLQRLISLLQNLF